ncbi:hypothetical protein AB0M54_19770 [Actinoplanes sp. NPDC051470]|uniref:hypothetical protein n=1 Tax=Actinoplanes sp. NPDC051470 TaxID=3157224 RepID=UPI003448D088
MRTLLRAGVLTLAAGSLLLGSTVAAQAAPAGTITIKADTRLVLQPAEFGHTALFTVSFHNTSDQPYSGDVTFTEPIAQSAAVTDQLGACGLGQTPDRRTIYNCGLDPIQPGETRLVELPFVVPAKPQPFAQIAPDLGTIEAGGSTVSFAAIFQSTTGSTSNPVPYEQDTTAALTVTAGDVVLRRQADGTFQGLVPVTVRNNGDAPHHDLDAEIALPAGIEDWPDLDVADGCTGGGVLPRPPGGATNGCSVIGGKLAEGQQRNLVWTVKAPAGSVPGSLGAGTALVLLNGGAARQTDGGDQDTFTVTIAP